MRHVYHRCCGEQYDRLGIDVRVANSGKPYSLALSTGYAKGVRAILQIVIPCYSRMTGVQFYTSPSPGAVAATLLDLFHHSQSSIASLIVKEIPKSISTTSPTLTMLSERPRIKSNDASRAARV